MIVHLITRVNLKTDTDFVFTEERKQVLFNRVAPTVKAQTYTDFEWIGLIEEWTPLEDYSLVFDKIYTWKWREVYNKYLADNKWKEIFSIRLDSDDCIHKNFIQRMVEVVDNTNEIQVIIANKGIDYNAITWESIIIQIDYPGSFLWVYEKKLEIWCYDEQHTLMDNNNTYLSETIDEPLWTRYVDWNNRVSNHLLSKYEICTEQ